MGADARRRVRMAVVEMVDEDVLERDRWAR
jgi:hypothetical protein